MAKFTVQHLVACLSAPWEGIPGPNTIRALEGVGYVYRIPPDTEFPFEELEFWVYARFYRVDTFTGRAAFSLRCIGTTRRVE